MKHIFYHSIALILLALSPLLTSAQKLEQNLPEDVIASLNKLPEKSLSLPYILNKAMKSSDKFQAIVGTLPSSKSPELVALAPLDVMLTAKYSYTDDNQEEASSSATSLEKNQSYSLGLSKYFQTGTTLSTALQNGNSTYTYPALYCDDPTAGPCEVKVGDTQVSIGIEQKLWQDFIGSSTRKKIRAGKLDSSIVFDQVIEATEDWSLSIASTYYRAWFDQQRVIAARQKLIRQNELSRITRLRVRRGSSAKPELLQIESAALAAQTELSRISEELKESWRLLVGTVKLPRSWLIIDPVYIPLAVEKEFSSYDQFCSKATSILTSNNASKDEITKIITNSPKVKRFTKSAESSQLKLRAEKGDARPDLSFFANYGANAYDDKQGKSLSEAMEFKNDYWSMGIKFSMPLGFRANRAQVYQQTANSAKSTAQASDAQTTHELNILKACAKIERLNENIKLLSSAVEKQTERSNIEQQRFKTGRIPILNAITASNDLSDTSLRAAQNLTELHLAYWDIKKLKGDIYNEMKENIGNK